MYMQKTMSSQNSISLPLMFWINTNITRTNQNFCCFGRAKCQPVWLLVFCKFCPDLSWLVRILIAFCKNNNFLLFKNFFWIFKQFFLNFYILYSLQKNLAGLRYDGDESNIIHWNAYVKVKFGMKLNFTSLCDASHSIDHLNICNRYEKTIVEKYDSLDY